MQRKQSFLHRAGRARRQSGVTMVTVLGALIALFMAMALAIDVGLVMSARNQTQNAADAAALAAAANMIDPAAPAVTIPTAQTVAVGQAAQHFAVPTASVAVDTADMTFGDWDLTTRTLNTGVDLSDPNQVTAVEVVARLDGGPNAPVSAAMSRVLGRASFDVRADATAYLGFAGTVAPGEVELPIAIDCCQLKGAECTNDYCASSAPINACDLESPEAEGAVTVTCLEFHNTAEQNACWTEFDGDSSSVNTPGLIDIVEDGNPVEVSVDEPVYLDNGDKVPVIAEIRDRFKGEGPYVGNASGTDRYLPINDPAVPDSWVVGLPVVECQTEAHCASGDPMDIVGVVCFEIREVLVTPEKIIKGRFLCPGDPLMDECDVGATGTGGLDFGVRADIPVLVR